MEELLRTHNPLPIGSFLQIASGPRICLCMHNLFRYSLPHVSFSGDKASLLFAFTQEALMPVLLAFLLVRLDHS